MLLPDETYEDYKQRRNLAPSLRVAAKGDVGAIKLNIANKCSLRKRQKHHKQLSDISKRGGDYNIYNIHSNSNSNNNKNNSTSTLSNSSIEVRKFNSCKNIVTSGLKFVKSKTALPQIVVSVSSSVQHHNHNGTAKSCNNSDCGESDQPLLVQSYSQSPITLTENMDFLRECERFIQKYNLRTDFFCQYYKAIRWVLILQIINPFTLIHRKSSITFHNELIIVKKVDF